MKDIHKIVNTTNEIICKIWPRPLHTYHNPYIHMDVENTDIQGKKAKKKLKDIKLSGI